MKKRKNKGLLTEEGIKEEGIKEAALHRIEPGSTDTKGKQDA